MNKPLVSVVVAKAQNGVIGKNNALPWHLPKDLAHFKRVTLGKPVIMGRLTYESIGRPLPGRANIVVSRQAGWSAEGVQVANSLEAAIELGASNDGVSEVMIIGGASLYQQAMGLIDRVYLTEIHADIDGDARFDALQADAWQEVNRTFVPADERNRYDMSFIELTARK